jgi:ribosomal protein S13
MASYMLTVEEQLPENKEEIMDYTEDVLQANGIECDNRISEMSDEQLKEILEQVRKLRRNKKKKGQQQEREEETESKVEEEISVISK